MARVPLTTLTRTITRDAVDRPYDLEAHVAERHGLTYREAEEALRQLAEAGWLEAPPTPDDPWAPGVLREVTQEYQIKGLDEHTPWTLHFAPCMDLNAAVARTTQHIFGELLNNAIDHSAGSVVTVSMRQNRSHLHMLMSDNGCGVFDKLGHAFELQTMPRTVLELSKGKLTTQPLYHTGRGLFFVSRLANVFELHANGWVFRRRDGVPQARMQKHPVERSGTTVFASIALDSLRTPEQVYRAHGTPENPWSFATTSVPLRLLTDEAALESRAQARWVCSRLEEFALAELDFEGVEDIGPSFADELFRVYARSNPNTRLAPRGMTPQVEELVRSTGL